MNASDHDDEPETSYGSVPIVIMMIINLIPCGARPPLYYATLSHSAKYSINCHSNINHICEFHQQIGAEIEAYKNRLLNIDSSEVEDAEKWSTRVGNQFHVRNNQF